jgi:hypothetical protein
MRRQTCLLLMAILCTTLGTAQVNGTTTVVENWSIVQIEHQLEMSGAIIAFFSWICVISMVQLYGGKTNLSRFTCLLAAGNYTLATVVLWVLPSDLCMQAVFPNIRVAQATIYVVSFICGTISSWIISPMYRKCKILLC